MPAIDVALRRLWRRIRDALPGPTAASRLRPDPASWRNAPPQQRAAAYVQYYQTLQQLRQIHVGQKIAPRIVNLLFAAICSKLGLQIALILAILVLVLLLNP